MKKGTALAMLITASAMAYQLGKKHYIDTFNEDDNDELDYEFEHVNEKEEEYD